VDVRMKLLFLCVFSASSVGCFRGCDFDNPSDQLDSDDGSNFTSDPSTFDLSLETTCHYEPVNEEGECGFDGVTLVCRMGLCGAGSLCAGVNCDDDDPCTVDVCDWDGMCSFTPVECDDGNDCTAGRCDPATGACVFEPGEGVLGGFCFPEDLAGDPPTLMIGECAEGVCTGLCDPTVDEPLECASRHLTDFFCCPGSEYCRANCGAQPAIPNAE
jgi:hypothetical protein